MNSVNIIGNLTRDPELRYTTNGKPVVNFDIAVDNGKDQDPFFFPVVAWEKTAENVAEYCKKGTKVGITGRLIQEKYEKDGQKRTITKIQAFPHQVQFLGQPQGNSQNNGSEAAGTPQGDPFANAGGDPFAGAGDPFANTGFNPFAGASGNPFANSGTGATPANASDPFAGLFPPDNDPFAGMK